MRNSPKPRTTTAERDSARVSESPGGKLLNCCAIPDRPEGDDANVARVIEQEAGLHSDQRATPNVLTRFGTLTLDEIIAPVDDTETGYDRQARGELSMRRTINTERRILDADFVESDDDEKNHVDWMQKGEELRRAFLNCAEDPVSPMQSPPSAKSGVDDGFKKTFNWLLCIVFPQGMRKDKTITREAAKAFYTQHFFPEEIVRSGQLLAAKAMEVETAAFLRAFDELPGPKPLEKFYERRIGNGAPQSFMELVRNALVVKLEAHAGLIVRSCFSRDGNYVYILISSGLPALLREAERSRFPTELALRTVDPLTLEPCTRTNISLAAWFTKYSPDRDVQRKLQEVVNGVSAADKRRFGALCKHYAKAASHKLEIGETKKSQSRFEEAVHKAEVRRQGGIIHEDHVGSPGANQKLKEAYMRYLDFRKEEGLVARGDQLIAKVNEELGVRKSFGKCLGKNGLINYWDLVDLPPQNPYAEYVEEWPAEYWRTYMCASRENNKWMASLYPAGNHIKLIRAALERVIDIEKMREDGVVTHFFPMDTREKIFRPLVGAEAERVQNGNTKEMSVLCKCMAIDEPTAMATFFAFCNGIRRVYPVRDIRDYYGEKIALYFAFVMHQLHPLFGMPMFAVIGLGVYLFQHAYPPVIITGADGVERMEVDPIRKVVDLGFALYVATYGTMFDETYGRVEKRWALEFGMLQTDAEDEAKRPQFRGTPVYSKITFEMEFLYPEIRRTIKKFLSSIVLSCFLVVAVMINVTICNIRTQWYTEHWRFEGQAMLITSGLCSGLITVVSGIGKAVAKKLNEWENHATRSSYVDSLAWKIFTFEFCNNFNVFIYIAFFKAIGEGCLEEVVGPGTDAGSLTSTWEKREPAQPAGAGC
jgi:hypothetical protein